MEERPERKPWSWPVRILYWFYNFFIGPFLTKLADGTIMGSMTRWVVALFAWAEYKRLVNVPFGQATPSEAFILFVIAFALPIDAAMTALAQRNPRKLVGMVTGALGKLASTASGYFGSSTTSYGGPSPDYVRPPDTPTDDKPDREREGDEP